MSRFAPDVDECRALVLSANARAAALSERIYEASKALKSGAPTVAVLAILDGATTDGGTNG